MRRLDSLFAHAALLPQGWTERVRLQFDAAGDIVALETAATPQDGERQAGLVLPGMTNLHSHAFQRALAGMTEVAATAGDSFWTWRDLMYRYALQLTPQQMQAIAAQIYSECLRHGYTSVCEFHYLHRAPDGAWYPDQAETARRVIAAAATAGIGMTMLPVLYSHADFADVPLRADQRRFATEVSDVLALVAALEPLRSAALEIGAAPHSLRAANLAQITELHAGMPAGRPIHIHIAEQTREVDACLRTTGKRPVELLLATGLVDQHWCLVHATHLNADEVTALAASAAVAGICPSTEGNLGDGFFDLPAYLAVGGRFGIGSDSHVSHSPVEELRWLEYGQRLRLQQRNIARDEKQRRVGDYLWNAALQGGAQASGRRVGQLQVGWRADLLVLDECHPNLAGLALDDVLNTWLFCGNDNLLRDVIVGGQLVVENGRHHQQAAIAADYIACLQNLRAL
ncbi:MULTISPECIES: formimidoylglutamate deiminase [unclassified Undibacterium]|uniref:formimidoylglutamate deiminase n=1 Tax=unclassified Undibacterium TaxID=2630295 RepID=UPI002AC962D1|nr:MULTISPECIES: formimidoylglutamate deiminase [unclassified Undibacterium]MEB0137433.1 formimidoylglutamate deiminase [Undibacterium sp. CCC2.1]MEB0170902.1 formimidoylglutamate deiminase [Undibacterium sp. CCC1.1]MEB0174854.1 formimidoylglutamate deiminase [Undibacterium sp. CCC3.4]MEB0214190.1 formimidoylglutamate deiminase [Undibacterium sp. 5I2]WPX44501.1 formimidoylglutamate deiminase [Undibacterium sp. CCC3.4]